MWGEITANHATKQPCGTLSNIRLCVGLHFSFGVVQDNFQIHLRQKIFLYNIILCSFEALV